MQVEDRIGERAIGPQSVLDDHRRLFEHLLGGEGTGTATIGLGEGLFPFRPRILPDHRLKELHRPPQPIRAPSQTQYPPVAPGMARVWFFRQMDRTAGNVYAGSPIVYANGAPIGDVPQGSVFFRDFAPGKYRFTVQPYGTPTPQHDTVQLVPGQQAYVQVQWEANWETGHTGGSSFTVETSSPEVAQQYIPTLTNLGQR